MKEKKFGSRLLRKYKLTIHNENKLKNVLGFYISPLWVILSLFFSFLLVAGVLYLIVVFTPVGNLLPGYMNDTTKEEFIRNNIRIDSLLNEVEKQDRYLANIKALLNGEVAIDSAKNSPQPINNEGLSTDATELEEQFVKEWEEREKYNITSQATNVAELQGLNMFRPTQGEVIRKFDLGEGHYGVDIAEIPGENILAIHDGTVILSDYTANEGFTIIVQHRENMASVYRNCHRLLKSVGEKVIAGEAIGTFRNITDTTGIKRDYLHFELWHRGKPLDPNVYIAF
ncbi:MAG: M23 family metallopeptidase [Bacteroidaceae bacterium]|nr:M23 family metallopeptidase [Bacteroidaceae bacterium]